MVIVATVLFVVALAVGGVAVAGLVGKLPRNRWAGVRTEATLRDDATFALANKVAAPALLGSAGLLVLGGVAALVLPTAGAIVAAVVATAAALVTAGAGGSIGARVAAALPAEASGCGHDCNCGSAPEPVEESAADIAAAADCGMDSCGACSLKGACQPS
ncbi:SdpI family protein [Rhodococcus sp. NPDC127528]|uniref:SdpI family protein n=1 Tax=unclassified Rhodococcus (in: high G+C Gram-positive bacteria) TaxID=192944 RepID=UPI0036438971